MPSAETLALITDALAWPLLLLRSDGSLIHANLAARQLLGRRHPFVLTPKGRLLPADAAQHGEYQAALAAAAQGGPGGQPPQLMQWATPTGRISVSVTALSGPAQRQALLLLALSPEHGRIADLRAYAAINGLSDAETRVLLHLARGHSSATAATELGVTAATVRSQTVALRRKTGHASVSALMRTLAALPPLAPGGADGEK
jgi:DNA-binding CsgD family transcriptional regulator